MPLLSIPIERSETCQAFFAGFLFYAETNQAAHKTLQSAAPPGFYLAAVGGCWLKELTLLLSTTNAPVSTKVGTGE